MSFEAVIGLEVHVQLRTETKMFCADPAGYGAEPNTQVCPVCLGLPGALPVTNRRAVELAVRAALGLGCTVHPTSAFARKNYFYPDLPKGYQITQSDRPLATGGRLEVPDGDAAVPIRIRRVHLEEDAGKSLHDRLADATALDFNRAGVPLIEIVTEPDLASPEQARAFLELLKRTLEYLDVSDCDMEKGSLRVDANVSVRRTGTSAPGTRTELKNLNSFSQVERALRFERERQARTLEAGGAVDPVTLLWDEDRGEARPLRAKDASEDYRYLPEPDLPPVTLGPDEIERIATALPEPPLARERRFRAGYGLPAYDAGVLTATRARADYFEAVARASGDAKAASNWIMTEVLAWLNERGGGFERPPVAAAALAELLGLIADGTISRATARDVFRTMAETGRAPAVIIDEEALAQVRDADRLRAWMDEALAEHPAEAERLRAGEEKLIGFFMGRIMRKSGGRADPNGAKAALRERLER